MSEPNAYQEVKKELDRTPVISKEFKQWILGWMMKGMQDSRELGRAEVLNREKDEAETHLLPLVEIANLLQERQRRIPTFSAESLKITEALKVLAD